MLDPKSIQRASELTLDGLIEYASTQNASDIFLKVGGPPGFRILGKIVKSSFPSLGPIDTERLAYEHFDAKQRAEFEREFEMNLSFTVPSIARIRQNVYRERG